MRLEQEYGGQIENVLVERIFFSEDKRVGIGTFTPSDPKSQDIADLTGSIDFSTIAEFGSESDPRAYRFDGELNKANRGMMEFQEMLKLDEKFLWHLLSLTQEGNFKAGRFALLVRMNSSWLIQTKQSIVPSLPIKRMRHCILELLLCRFRTI